MPVYRLHFLEADKRTGRAYKLECATDGQAIAKASRLHHTHGVDIWEGARRVAHIAGSLNLTKH